ncbi:hypothetical protein PAXRUDRAFT_153248, partial [Paxillus rubicundulus Ve08.2h10]
AVYCIDLFSDPSGKFTKLLDLMLENDCGCMHLLCWIEPHAVEQVCEKITSEMDEVKRALAGDIKSITPESLLMWDVNPSIRSVINQNAPITGQILGALYQVPQGKA